MELSSNFKLVLVLLFLAIGLAGLYLFRPVMYTNNDTSPSKVASPSGGFNPPASASGQNDVY